MNVHHPERFRVLCTQCTATYTASAVPILTALCPACQRRAESQDRVIAAKFNPNATPELPFRPTKETTRATR